VGQTTRISVSQTAYALVVVVEAICPCIVIVVDRYRAEQLFFVVKIISVQGFASCVFVLFCLVPI
jgi:hypothetical protein